MLICIYRRDSSNLHETMLWYIRYEDVYYAPGKLQLWPARLYLKQSEIARLTNEVPPAALKPIKSAIFLIISF